MSKFRLYPDARQEQLLLGHCSHARYVWNLAVEQHKHWKPTRKSAPGFAEQCRQLTEARAENEWLRAGSAIVQQQALRDFWNAKQRFFESGFGHPDWRKKHYDEGFRIVDTCEAARRKDWCEKTSTELARSYDVIRFEKLNIINMTLSAKGTLDKPGRNVAQKAGLNRAILAQGWGLLRRRTKEKAPGRVQDVPAPFTSLRCSACGWIDKNSRKSQAEYVCSSCGFKCNADVNAALNVAAGHVAGTTPRKRASVREPHLANP